MQDYQPHSATMVCRMRLMPLAASQTGEPVSHRYVVAVTGGGNGEALLMVNRFKA